MDLFAENNNNNDAEVMNIFQNESEEILERLFNNLFIVEETPTNKEAASNIYRDMHSLKGATRMVGFNNIQMIIHKAEDIFDAVMNNNYVLTKNTVQTIEHALELVSKYLQESVKNLREIIDDNFKPTLSSLEYIVDVEIADQGNEEVPSILDGLIDNVSAQIPTKETPAANEDISSNQEKINQGFNNSFEIIDGIVPEEETLDLVILKEEVEQIYEYFKETNIYEVKTSLENIIAKLDFVMKATNTLTISEILELRNELSSAVSKFTTYCLEEEDAGSSFFDVSEKFNMLQGSSVYAKY